jgi:exodeoxyribonuclease VII small subunit
MARTGTRQPRPSERDDDNVSAIGEDLSYSEAQTALELALAQLQATDLPVESMGELYLRARSYAQRCEQLLTQVEQSIALWDPDQPDATPKPLEP